MSLTKIKSLFCCKTIKKTTIFIKNNAPIFENNIDRQRYCLSMINMYNFNKYFHIGITKNPNKKNKKLKNINNLDYLYLFAQFNYSDAKIVIDYLLDYYYKSNYCLNKQKLCEKIKNPNDKYYIYIALKHKLKFF